MAFFNKQKLYALIKKNIILMKRNILLTLFEIFFPIIMFLLIIGLRKSFKIESYKFEKRENNTENYFKQQSIYSVSQNKLIEFWAEFQISSFIPPMYICSKNNSQQQERPLIASIGIPQEIKNKMIEDNNFFSELNFSLNNNSFKEFTSIKEMENYIKSPDYLKNKKGLICFGLKFSYNEDIQKYNYSLHFFDQRFDNDGIQDIPNNVEGMFDEFQTRPDLDSYTLYKFGTYSYMLKIINEYILNKELGVENAKLNFLTVPMRYDDYKSDKFGDIMGFMITIIIVVAYMAPLSLYVYRIVGEKESRIKETMKIMGLSETEYFLSFFIQYLIISIIVSLINALLFKVTFSHIPFYFLYFLILLWALDIFALVYFFQSFIDKKRIALILSLVIYFIMYCISLLCVFDKRSLFLKIILSIFPPVGLNIGILLLNKFEYHFKYFFNKDFSIQYNNYSIRIMYLMFLIDFFFYLLVGYYLENVLPHELGIHKPWYFLCTKNYWFSFKKYKNELKILDENPKMSEKKENYIINDEINNESTSPKIDNDLYNNSSNFESESIYLDKFNKGELLKIRDIKKIFGDGKKAVNGVNLNLYKDEIFALLGQNGAGKTTLISILTGIYQATSGKAIYNGINILDSINMDFFREKLGICPQHDILFDNLNVREHLEMFSIFKGVNSKDIKNEVNRILKDFKMEEIEDVNAVTLSAGQRRKLSIAMALIGGSEVIFLDEPSSGMDISSRKDLWEILKYQCKGKIIILTTHYMEEARVLGKRIGIIHLGQMKCIGSPLFLIEKYGLYMNLIITKEKGSKDDNIIKFISENFSNINYEIISEEISFRIQIKNEIEEDINENNNRNDLSDFFKNLDENLNTLKIKSYNILMPTLEDVFLNVSSGDFKKSINAIHKELLKTQNNDIIIFKSDLKKIYSPFNKFINDFKINAKRRFLIIIRDIKGFIMEIFCPIIIVLIGLAISKSEMNYKSSPALVDIKITGKQKILFASLIENNGTDYDFLRENIENVEIQKMDEFDYFNFNPHKRNEALQLFIDLTYYKTRDNENSEKNIIDTTAEDYVGYYSGLMMLEQNKVEYNFIILLNTRVKHCIPIYTSFFLKSIIEKATNKTIDISFMHYPLPLTNDIKDLNKLGSKLTIVFFIGIAFSLQPINFISLLVGERINNSKHLMRISGINILSYWSVNYIFDIIKYYFTCGICLLLLYFFHYYKKYLVIFYLIYGPTMVSLTYFLSFFFSSESSAQNIIILIYFVFGDLGSIIICLLRGNKATKTFAKVLEYILALNPLFCFNFSFNLLLNSLSIYNADYPNEWKEFKGDEIIKRFNLLLSMIIYLAIECILYTLFLTLKENRAYSFSKQNLEIIGVGQQKNELINLPSSSREEPNKKPVKNGNALIKVKELEKIYKKGCFSRNTKSIIALKDISFSLNKKECFGLLGFSGSGKTTTFKCITQELFPDKGKILINGIDIKGKFNYLKEKFGYCPQFNAIFEHLTVYENLEFYARIKNINPNSISTLVNSMINEMSLKKFKKKISKNLSGGNKRKLSVAISILCTPTIILLDEPATGIDPEARRSMWSIIHKMTEIGGSSVIMSTHSMDEAEILCKKIGILIKGEFVCNGKPSEIKEKYGKGHEINLRIKTFKKELFFENIDENTLVNNENLEDILTKLNKTGFIGEFKEGKLGEKIDKIIALKNNITIYELKSWIFYVENALKIIDKGKNIFEKVILLEHFENNFLFKIEKKKENSIGNIFAVFEKNKEECFVAEYSIQQNSLEQIFINFANNQNENDEIKDKGILIDERLLRKILN